MVKAKNSMQLLTKYCDELHQMLLESNSPNPNSLFLALKGSLILEKAITSSVGNIGEVSNKVPTEFKNRVTSIKWANLYRTRNIVVHDYEAIDFSVLCTMVFTQIMPLRTILHAEGY